MRKYNPTSSDHSVVYPQLTSEFEIQAMVWNALRQKGIDARGEVNFRGSFGLRPTKNTCRFDVIVFEDKKARLILEIKNGVAPVSTAFEQTRQPTRYRTFGVPVWFVYGEKDAMQAIEDAVAFLTAPWQSTSKSEP